MNWVLIPFTSVLKLITYIKHKFSIQEMLTYLEVGKFIFRVHERSAPHYINQLSSVNDSMYFKSITRYYAEVLSNFR
jgi:hypothetical protein